MTEDAPNTELNGIEDSCINDKRNHARATVKELEELNV